MTTCFQTTFIAASLLLLASSCSSRSEVETEENAPDIAFVTEVDQIHVSLKGKRFTTYHFGEKWPKPFLHPVFSLDGRDVTRGWPVVPREGESDDHIWHRGLFMGHDQINGVDFWREKEPEQTARLVPRVAPRTDQTTGTLQVELDLLTPKRESIGAFKQKFTFSASGKNAVIDVEATIVADRDQKLELGDTEEGFVGFRFHDAFTEKNGAWITNSSGLSGSENIWGKRALWVDYSTILDNAKIGVAMFDHPSNPRHPTFWHARGYGLCGINAFGIRNFTGDETRDGTMTIPKDGELKFRYRFVIHPGDATESEVVQLHKDYYEKSKL